MIWLTGEDGTISYSKIVTPINEVKGLLITALWPNPVQSNINLVIISAKAERLRFSIIDLSGKIMKQWDVNAREGSNTISINTERLSTGVYLLNVYGNNGKVCYRFIKQ